MMSSKSDKKRSKSLISRWVQKESRSKPGKFYFFNTATGETTWSRPDGVAIETSHTSDPPRTNAPVKRKSNVDRGADTSPNSKKSKVLGSVDELGRSDGPKQPLPKNEPISSKRIKAPEQPTSKWNSVSVQSTSNDCNSAQKTASHQPQLSLNDRLPSCSNTGSKTATQESSGTLSFSIKKKEPLQTSSKVTNNVNHSLPVKNDSIGFLDSFRNGRRRRKSRKQPYSTAVSSTSKTNPANCLNNRTAKRENIAVNTSTDTRGSAFKRRNSPVSNDHANDNRSKSVPNERSNLGGISKNTPLASTETRLQTTKCGNLSAQDRLKNLQSKLSADQYHVRLEPLEETCWTSSQQPSDKKVPNDYMSVNEGNIILKDSSTKLPYQYENSLKTESFRTEASKYSPQQKSPFTSQCAGGLAASRLSELSSKLKSDETESAKDSTHHFPSHCSGGLAARRLAQLQSKLKSELTPGVDHTCFNSENTKSYIHTPQYKIENDEAMEVEYMEADVLSDIGELRQKDITTLNHQTVFMDVDFDVPIPLPSDNHPVLHIVLDTNVLLSYLQFVQGLRDSLIPGKGPVHLYLPWQVLQELDHLKDRGKSQLQNLARQAINYLHDNLSSKHPRVRGQRPNEVVQNSCNSPDDNILQACLQLHEQGCDVVLLSNDKNLLNKALICNVNAFSRDQFVEHYHLNTKASTGIQECANNKSELNLNDIIICEMKQIIKQSLSNVVQDGMRAEYQTLWEKRTIIRPPWDTADQVLQCLCHHWLPICDDFIPASVKSIIENLIDFLKFKTKKYGISSSDIKEGLQLTQEVYEAIPSKYSSHVNCAVQQLQELNMKLENSCASIGMNETDETHAASSNEKCTLVLLCFEDALNAVQNLCKPESQSDPAWMLKAKYMVQAVYSLVNLMNQLLSKPLQSLNEDEPVVNELVTLIKGERCITPKDVIEFTKEEHNRTLMLNGISQFTTLKDQLCTVAS